MEAIRNHLKTFLPTNPRDSTKAASWPMERWKKVDQSGQYIVD